MKKNHMFVPTIIFLTIGTILYGISLYIKISINMMLEPKTEPVENGQYLVGILALGVVVLGFVCGFFYFPSIVIYICIFIFNYIIVYQQLIHYLQRSIDLSKIEKTRPLFALDWGLIRLHYIFVLQSVDQK